MFWVILAGVALRVLASFFGVLEPGGDPANYEALAQSLRLGAGLTLNDPVYGENIRGLYPPLYPLLLAMFVSPLALNTLCDIASAALLRAVEPRGIASSILFLWPSQILSAPVPQKESLLIFLSVWLFVIVVQRGPSWLFGGLSGLLLLTQPSLALLPPALALIFRAPVRWLVGAGLAGVTVLAPWWVRNWMMFGTFVPFTTAGGAQIAVALQGDHLPPPRLDLPETQRFALAGQAALEHFSFRSYLAQQGQRIALGLFRESSALVRIYPEPSLWVVRPLQLAWLALIGISLFCRDRLALKWLLAGLIALLVALPLEFGERHRAHLLPIFCLMAVVTLSGRARLRLSAVQGEYSRSSLVH